MASSELIFRAMSEMTRQRLLRVLSLHDLNVSEMVEVLGLPQSTISRHLKVLREAGLLVDRRVGANVMYAAAPMTAAADQGQQDRAASEENAKGSRRQAEAGVSGKEEAAQGLGEAGGADRVKGRRRGETWGHSAAGYGVVGLRDWLLDWIGRTRLEEDVAERLDRVVRRRREAGGGFFDAVAVRWDQLRVEAFGEVFHLEALTALLPSEWTVADIGSGTGYLLPILSARFRRVIAVDPSARMLELARTRPEVRSAENIEFREGSLASLPVADGELDLAVVSLVLHHVEDPGLALAAIRRCLRPGGTMMMIEQEAHELAAFHERMGDLWSGFAPDRLTEWLTNSGFADVRVSPLSTARPSGRGRIEAPRLFVLTARAGKASDES
jgi:ubiquinone/menaquinone biosynthesis C-methylase UbiE/DNA-binding transcriptional ArsR family regulator